MNSRIKDLITRQKEIKERLQKDAIKVDEVQCFLNEIKKSGRLIVDLDDRVIVGNLAHELGEILYTKYEVYPVTRLDPPDLSFQKIIEVFKKPPRFTFGGLIILTGFALILFQPFWMMVLKIFNLETLNSPESDLVKITRLIVGLILVFFGIHITFFMKSKDGEKKESLKPPKEPEDRPLNYGLHEDPHWHLKIDRWEQYDAIIAKTHLMLQERRPKSLVFVWYGLEGQGIEVFHKRLSVELRETHSKTGIYVHQVRPRWPQHLKDYDAALSDIFSDAFNVKAIEEIPGRLRSKSRGGTTLLYVRHEPVTSSKIINPESLKAYVRWWDGRFIPLLERRQFAVLTVSFIVRNPIVFAEYMAEEKIYSLDSDYMVFWLLAEMKDVNQEDLLKFFRTHNINLPKDTQEQFAQEILDVTKGKYEPTVEELKKRHKEIWARYQGDVGVGKRGGREYDY